ncbi:TetR family transcriptional regulator [Sphingopyxis sp. H038]|nr:TetR family transcriptional regulator [Sphingopyxis sp. H012]KTE06318.1 TetR family transcriptional regulator [Sphingopyxis sp. H093]KTE09322.1 TetR family transcriptional regulator [Sphingopyxis sp. H053]KTE27641.1 TetR family transcriptional regulator [Sphingopyxis sp. H080]KTE35188.1 TetR family transcriptional regulator [Sphingopyxis sp. H038]KTE40794.1 TetR family transcriptional regulator [Sphingopyxis sp. H077]KTE44053.1 TetR family transcriptional regulator [Sphingopyxis sp. H005]
MSIEMIPDSTPALDDAAAIRRKAFVDAARELFFANGYAGTTMSSIASKVGGSKTTLWTYFPSKEELFAAVVDDIVAQYGDALAIDLPLDEPVPDVLRVFGNLLMTKLTATPILSLFRLVVGEAERFPHLAETFYERGPRRGKARAAVWVGEKMVRGEIRMGDPMRAVQQFTGLCQSGIYQFAMLNLPESRDLDRLRDDVDAAVDTFCRAWSSDD